MYEVSSVCAPEGPVSGVLGCRNENFEKGSVESTYKVPTSHYHTKPVFIHTSAVKFGARTENAAPNEASL